MHILYEGPNLSKAYRSDLKAGVDVESEKVKLVKSSNKKDPQGDKSMVRDKEKASMEARLYCQMLSEDDIIEEEPS